MRFPVGNEEELTHIDERKELATRGILLIIVFLKRTENLQGQFT